MGLPLGGHPCITTVHSFSRLSSAPRQTVLVLLASRNFRRCNRLPAAGQLGYDPLDRGKIFQSAPAHCAQVIGCIWGNIQIFFQAPAIEHGVAGGALRQRPFRHMSFVLRNATIGGYQLIYSQLLIANPISRCLAHQRGCSVTESIRLTHITDNSGQLPPCLIRPPIWIGIWLTSTEPTLRRPPPSNRAACLAHRAIPKPDTIGKSVTVTQLIQLGCHIRTFQCTGPVTTL